MVDNEGRIEYVMYPGDFVSFTWPELLVRIKDIAKRAHPVRQIADVGAYTLAIFLGVRHAL